MTTLTATPEQLVITIAEPLLAVLDDTATISVGIPTDWTPGSPPHVQVAQDSPLDDVFGAAVWALIRFTVWHTDTYRAQQLAIDLWRTLLAHDGTPPVSIITPGTGPIPATDPNTGVEHATFTVNTRLRHLTLTST